MRRPPGFSNGADGTQAHPVKSGMQIGAQLTLAAKKMPHPGDIGDQPIGAICRHHRCIAHRPAPHRFQRRRLGLQISQAGGQVGANGTGIRQRHAPHKTQGQRRPIHTMQMIGIA